MKVLSSFFLFSRDKISRNRDIFLDSNVKTATENRLNGKGCDFFQIG
ncbi:unnamed protein product [Larinioides sclopetarius]|uniref:Uncharacterized protein n=1 Tax=Larinioides sclopetarius TaxID=280406 RepID=A0AAV2ARW3_9ARAC